MEDMNNAKNFESKNISISLRSSQCQEGNYSLLLLIIRRVYALVRELNTSLITGSRLDCVSFSTVGIAVGEEKLSLRTAGHQVASTIQDTVRYCSYIIRIFQLK